MTLFSTRPTRLFRLGALALLGLSSMAWAVDDEPKAWQESTVVPPARFSTEAVVPFKLTETSSLTFGIDPQTLTVDPDGVVRYVLVARSSSGALNVLYEGIRCTTAEVKLYARWDNVSAWNVSGKETWQPLSFRGATRRAMQMARGGVCEGPTPNGSPARILEALKGGGVEKTR